MRLRTIGLSGAMLTAAVALPLITPTAAFAAGTCKHGAVCAWANPGRVGAKTVSDMSGHGCDPLGPGNSVSNQLRQGT
ncbi:hypothetical protein ACFU99_11955 [Streptomyces sp. NPDC057654]|uniref:hypothetical protein n=1 Tax=Streptomyces sp. NPDC057654 TaxID=3346196 RepID=UPI0036D0AF5A